MLVTAHIPPKHKQLIRRYGLYAYRSRGKWEEQEHIVKLAPEGWKEKKGLEEVLEDSVVENLESTIETKKQKSAWAKLIKKVYGIDPLVCPKCQSDMKIIAVIMEPAEINKVLHHLVKIGRGPPDFDINTLN